MNSLIKLSILILKSILFFIPREKVRSFKNSFPYITSLYSQGIRRAGIAQVFPNPKANQAAYEKIITRFDEDYTTLQNVDDSLISIVLLVPKFDLTEVQNSIASVPNNIDVWVVCKEGERQAIETVSNATESNNILFYNGSFEATCEHNPLFLIYSGEMLHRLLLGAIRHFSQGDEDILYVDTDVVIGGLRCQPSFLPQWNPDLQLSTAYINTGVFVRKASLIQGNLDCSYESIAAWVASIYIQKSKLKIGHVPHVLVHKNGKNKLVLSRYAKRLNEISEASVRFSENRGKRVVVVKRIIELPPLVSIIIPTKNAHELVKTCIESILKSTYTHYEILLVDNQSDDPASIKYFDSLKKQSKIKVLKYPKAFNYSAINNFAARHSNGDIIGLINNDIEAINPQWLELMVAHALRDDIGCVGAKLLYPDERVQHAGVVIGYGGGAGHAHKYFPRYHPGYMKRLSATNNYSAVTAACLLVKKSDFLRVGGLNEKNLTVAFNDVDFCLKVAELGRFNVYCAEAELFHHESVSRGYEDTLEKQQRFASELTYIQDKWCHYIENDPAYNPNLSLKRENFSISEGEYRKTKVH